MAFDETEMDQSSDFRDDRDDEKHRDIGNMTAEHRRYIANTAAQLAGRSIVEDESKSNALDLNYGAAVAEFAFSLFRHWLGFRYDIDALESNVLNSIIDFLVYCNSFWSHIHTSRAETTVRIATVRMPIDLSDTAADIQQRESERAEFAEDNDDWDW